MRPRTARLKNASCSWASSVETIPDDGSRPSVGIKLQSKRRCPRNASCTLARLKNSSSSRFVKSRQDSSRVTGMRPLISSAMISKQGAVPSLDQSGIFSK